MLEIDEIAGVFLFEQLLAGVGQWWMGRGGVRGGLLDARMLSRPDKKIIHRDPWVLSGSLSRRRNKTGGTTSDRSPR